MNERKNVKREWDNSKDERKKERGERMSEGMREEDGRKYNRSMR